MTSRSAAATSNPLVVDTLLAIALTGLSVVTLLAGAQDIGSYAPESIALLLLQTLPIAFRRVAPVPVLVVTMAATVLHALMATDSLNTTLGSLIALFTVAERADRRTASVAGIAVAGAFAWLIVSQVGIPASLGSLVQTELAVVVAWTLGTWSRERRVYVGTVEERAARAEADRAAEAQRAVAEERERIARELHDVVTHHVSVIVIQAGAASRAIDHRPDDARAAIDAIDATGRAALADMRRMLGILGTGGAAGSGAGNQVGDPDPEVDGLVPMPGLDRLGALLESVRAAGLPVELAIEGDRRPLDPGVELSAYRIIQEALTNTLKHAHGARSIVRIRYERDALDVRVTDTGGAGPNGLADASGGRGLVGMRERVALFGGTLDAGPDPTGFHVAARLPLDPVTAPR